MLDGYIRGAATQLIERATSLKGEIPRPPRLWFQRLVSQCCIKIDGVIAELKRLRDDPDLKDSEAEPLRLLEFRRLAAQIDRVENAAIAAMARSSEKESAVNQLLDEMTREIIYPIEFPTVSLLSQNYFYISTDFQLMCIPLMELHFLLHLPDIYHELAHPLFRVENDPRVKAWLEAYNNVQVAISAYFTKQIVKLESDRMPESTRQAVATAYQNWQCQWVEEFFCDLFGVFSAGPAYAWAHLHLHAERGRNSFQLPRRSSSHPADAPRMAVMLEALSLIKEGKAATKIDEKWQSLLAVAGNSQPSDFHRYYPKHLLRKCAVEAHEGFIGMGCKPWPGSDKDKVRKILNEAWSRFWTSPQTFATWEKESAEALLQSKS
ncbi:MAG: hypothetical protein HY298_20805 [Verrucomicrobia bacterium]|nr:hypothetical protein [Verrucomicrobiota bacterium]